MFNTRQYKRSSVNPNNAPSLIPPFTSPNPSTRIIPPQPQSNSRYYNDPTSHQRFLMSKNRDQPTSLPYNPYTTESHLQKNESYNLTHQISFNSRNHSSQDEYSHQGQLGYEYNNQSHQQQHSSSQQTRLQQQRQSTDSQATQQLSTYQRVRSAQQGVQKQSIQNNTSQISQEHHHSSNDIYQPHSSPVPHPANPRYFTPNSHTNNVYVEECDEFNEFSDEDEPFTDTMHPHIISHSSQSLPHHHTTRTIHSHNNFQTNHLKSSSSLDDYNDQIQTQIRLPPSAQTTSRQALIDHDTRLFYQDQLNELESILQDTVTMNKLQQELQDLLETQQDTLNDAETNLVHSSEYIERVKHELYEYSKRKGVKLGLLGFFLGFGITFPLSLWLTHGALYSTFAVSVGTAAGVGYAARTTGRFIAIRNAKSILKNQRKQVKILNEQKMKDMEARVEQTRRNQRRQQVRHQQGMVILAPHTPQTQVYSHNSSNHRYSAENNTKYYENDGEEFILDEDGRLADLFDQDMKKMHNPYNPGYNSGNVYSPGYFHGSETNRPRRTRGSTMAQNIPVHNNHKSKQISRNSHQTPLQQVARPVNSAELSKLVHNTPDYKDYNANMSRNGQNLSFLHNNRPHNFSAQSIPAASAQIPLNNQQLQQQQQQQQQQQHAKLRKTTTTTTTTTTTLEHDEEAQFAQLLFADSPVTHHNAVHDNHLAANHLQRHNSAVSSSSSSSPHTHQNVDMHGNNQGGYYSYLTSSLPALTTAIPTAVSDAIHSFSTLVSPQSLFSQESGTNNPENAQNGYMVMNIDVAPREVQRQRRIQQKRDNQRDFRMSPPF